MVLHTMASPGTRFHLGFTNMTWRQSMKKLLLMTAVLLTVGAVAAMADSVNLGFACRTSANNATAGTNDYSPGGVGTCDDGTTAVDKRLVCSFKSTTTMTGFGGTQVTIDIDVAGAAPSPFWELGAGGCRDGALSAPATLSTIGATGCTNTFTVGGADPLGQNDTPDILVIGNRIHYRAIHVRKTTVVDLPPPTSVGGYIANNVLLAMTGNDGACAGCDQPACLVLNEVQYFSTQEVRYVTTPDLRNWITFQGGAPNCPGATPTNNTTWGKVKALYR